MSEQDAQPNGCEFCFANILNYSIFADERAESRIRLSCVAFVLNINVEPEP